MKSTFFILIFFLFCCINIRHEDRYIEKEAEGEQQRDAATDVEVGFICVKIIFEQTYKKKEKEVQTCIRLEEIEKRYMYCDFMQTNYTYLQECVKE
jgi:hypothetical protein